MTDSAVTIRPRLVSVLSHGLGGFTILRSVLNASLRFKKDGGMHIHALSFTTDHSDAVPLTNLYLYPVRISGFMTDYLFLNNDTLEKEVVQIIQFYI